MWCVDIIDMIEALMQNSGDSLKIEKIYRLRDSDYLYCKTNSGETFLYDPEDGGRLFKIGGERGK